MLAVFNMPVPVFTSSLPAISWLWWPIIVSVLVSARKFPTVSPSFMPLTIPEIELRDMPALKPLHKIINSGIPGQSFLIVLVIHLVLLP